MAWKIVTLSYVAQLAKRTEAVEPTKKYRQVGVRLWGAGAYERATIIGSETAYASFIPLRRDDIIVNKIWARNGSVSVIDEELEGAYGSSEFPVYEINQSTLLPRFFYWFTKSRILWDQCDRLSRGTSGQNRLKPDDFLKVMIPLPSLDEQQKIVQRLDSIQKKLAERRRVLEEAERDINAMLFNSFQRIVDGVKHLPLSEVAPLVRRPVEVTLEAEYLELGVRSFGKGTFHKPTLTGAEIGNKRLFEIHDGDLLFNIVFAWEGAIAVPGPKDHGRVGSHRFLTCVPKPQVAKAEFLRYYLLTPEGLQKIGTASPGGAGRNRTLGIKKAEQILVPIPNIEVQQCFVKLCAHVEQMRSIRALVAKDAEALIPAMLHEVFEPRMVGQKAEPAISSSNIVHIHKAPTVVIDTPFKEAVLVGAIVKVFHEDGGQPIGNFRLQKAVYFARRHMGESALDKEYLRKAAGPYNPSMRYSGGIKVAMDKQWIKRDTGKFGEGSALGCTSTEMDEWIQKYQLGSTAAWVRDRFKFKSNDVWETLATIDYAMLALKHGGSQLTPDAIFAYIEADEEWCPKIEKLKLTKELIRNNMIVLESLFADIGS